MIKNKGEKGDGLSFHNAVKLSTMTAPEIYKLMDIASVTFYRLFKKAKFTDDEKAAAAKALNKNVDEIFPPITTNNNEKVQLKDGESNSDPALPSQLTQNQSDMNKDGAFYLLEKQLEKESKRWDRLQDSHDALIAAHNRVISLLEGKLTAAERPEK